MGREVDPVTTEVVARHTLATAEEMGAALIRAAYSPNIKERYDCSTAIFDAKGQVIAQAHHVPIHLGSMIGAVDYIRQRFGGQNIKPGDMFLANDPYNGGGTHLPDINIIAPVFRDGRIVAFTACIAHHADVGGMVPGSESAACETIFQEGLRLPAVRVMNQGEICRDIIDIILLNSRTPEERLGDLRAQLAANFTGLRSMEALFERYGTDVTEQAFADYLDFTERRFEAAIRRLPAGVYESEDYLSGDTPDKPAKIKLKLTVGNGIMHFDFDGTAPQLKSARNVPHQALLATVYVVAKSMLDPDVPANAGYFRTMRVEAPAGSLVGPVPPAAVGTRSASCGVIGDVVAAALSQAMPKQAIAGSGPHHLLTWSGFDHRNEKYFVHYETVAGAMGGMAFRDGHDGVRTHASGSANLPIEALEHAFPLRVERYALRDGSDGAGKFCGGRGLVRDYRVLGREITVSLSAERQHEPAHGMHGGGDARTGRFVFNPGTPEEKEYFSGAKEVRMEQGSLMRVETPGGAGFGDPKTRSHDLIARDIREGRITAAAAQAKFGWSGQP